jgi:hypothetical protein
MPFDRDDDGAYRWDARKGRDRWGASANRAPWIEMCELLIRNGRLGSFWDTLALNRPEGLERAEERMLVRSALQQGAETGQLDKNMVTVLLPLIGGKDRPRHLNRDPELRRAIREALEKQPGLTLGQLQQKFPNVARSVLQTIRTSLAK